MRMSLVLLRTTVAMSPSGGCNKEKHLQDYEDHVVQQLGQQLANRLLAVSPQNDAQPSNSMPLGDEPLGAEGPNT